jgi:hypothetical protein
MDTTPSRHLAPSHPEPPRRCRRGCRLVNKVSLDLTFMVCPEKSLSEGGFQVLDINTRNYVPLSSDREVVKRAQVAGSACARLAQQTMRRCRRGSDRHRSVAPGPAQQRRIGREINAEMTTEGKIHIRPRASSAPPRHPGTMIAERHRYTTKLPPAVRFRVAQAAVLSRSSSPPAADRALYSLGRSYQIRPSFNVICATRRRLAVTVLPSLSRNSKLPSRNSNRAMSALAPGARVPTVPS